jgi:hypothetical protein
MWRTPIECNQETIKKENSHYSQVDLVMKGARHAQSLANKTGVHMKTVEVANEYLKVVKEDVGTRGDIAGIYGARRVEAGMKV